MTDEVLRRYDLTQEMETAFWEHNGSKAAAFSVVAGHIASIESRLEEIERKLGESA